MTKPLKVVWASNSPAIGSGYGNQTDLFTNLMKQRGLDPIVRGFWGHYGTTINHDGVTVLPATYDDIGQDALEYDYARHNPDVFVILYDMWAYNPEKLSAIPVTAWSPIDHQPVPPQVANRLQYCKWVWAMSRFGEREMRQAGLDPFYVPHGVDTEVYKPSDRGISRHKWGMPDDKFVVVVNAANKGYPSRKSLDKILKAWGLFVQTHPNAFLYMHTNVSAIHQGYNLLNATAFYNIPENAIGFPDQNKLRDGEITPLMLSHLYNAADVFLSPSAGEGFGIPVLEAQAAGCPVIVSDFTAQRELGEVGYKIPVDRIDDLYYTMLGSEQAWIRPSAIITGLEWAYEQRGNTALRAQAREFAMEYDAAHVFDRYMLPSLKIMAQGNADWRLERGLKAAPMVTVEPPPSDHVHAWSPVSLWNNGELCAPCKVKTCTAGLRVRRDKSSYILPNAFPNTVNGVALDIEDDPNGGVAKIIMREIESSYNLDVIDFQPGDVVIDIGGQVGIVSIYLAKKYPGIKVYAFEPSPDNMARLIRNVKVNGAFNVSPYSYAVTGDGRTLDIHGNPEINSGGISAFTSNGTGKTYTVESMTLEQIFKGHNIDRCKLLKIDCEGAEYEILGKTPLPILQRIDNVRGEIHINERLKTAGYDPQQLIETLQKVIGKDAVQAHICEIAA